MNEVTVLKPGVRPKVSALTLAALIAGLSACTSETPDDRSGSSAKTRTPAANEPAKPAASVKVGDASWYGPGFDGKETATGEKFDSGALTAASPNLPLGSKAVVTNLENGKKTEVVINDRGPYAQGRILDVSKAAAKKLGMVKDGEVRVKVVAKHHKARKKLRKKTRPK